MKVLIVVTHLLGTGHLARALTLGRAFETAGHRVTLASGGTPAPQLSHHGMPVVQLPPLRSDGVNFSRLLTDVSEVAGAAYLKTRQGILCDLLQQTAPDVVITELYPFGRRSLKAEFLALLETTQALPRRPKVLASIRDILAPPSKPKKSVEADEIIATYYDAVLVHSDPKATTLEASWPVSPSLARKLRYTGYVAPAAASPHATGAGRGEILVSAGGGNVGDALYACAVAAARLMPEHPWRILVGGAEAEARIKALHDASSPAILEPARPDFRQMLPLAAASVSMCGYNTTLDLLQAGTPAVLVPFDEGNEVEQSLRADSLASLPAITVERAGTLTPERLCAALNTVLHAPARPKDSFRFDGAARSVEIAESLLGESA